MPELTYAQEPANQSPSGAFALYPLAQLSAAFASGILGGSYFAVPLSLLIPSAALATLLAGIVILTSERNASASRSSATILVMLAAFVVGATLESIENSEAPANQLRSL